MGTEDSEPIKPINPEGTTSTSPGSPTQGTSWQSTSFAPRNRTRKTTKRAIAALQIATPFIATAALFLSLASLFARPEAKHMELEDALVTRREQLDQQLHWIEPTKITNAWELKHAINSLAKWKREWNEFIAAYRAHGALTSEIRRGEADVFDNLRTSYARKKEQRLKAVATQATKPPTPDSQVILDADEVIQLARLLIDIAWADDIGLATLLEERANWEEPRNTQGAKDLRKLLNEARAAPENP